MKKEFVDKVIKNGVVDTKKYRYVYSVSAEKAEIRRIAIDLLDTTATINGWEIVKVIDDRLQTQKQAPGPVAAGPGAGSPTSNDTKTGDP